MTSIACLQFLTYFSILFFVSGSIAKAIRYGRQPLHLRWELYPIGHQVGHETKGSYLGSLDWRTRQLHRNFWREIAYMATEIFLFKKLYYGNKGLWYFTFLFHTGLFLLVSWILLLLIGALIVPHLKSTTELSLAEVQIILHMTIVTGVAGFVFSIAGCIGLLLRRIFNVNLRAYMAPAQYFNLSFILAILLSGLYSWYFYDPAFNIAREFVRSLIVFGPVANMNPAMSIGIVLLSLFLVYVPFTTMMHGLAKYFTYHRVLWDDLPNLCGTDIEKKIGKLLNQPIGWSARHIQSVERWSDIMSGGNKTR